MFLYLISLPLIYQETVQMPKTIISDTSCFIILNNINELDILHKVYGQITTTIDIANEFGDKLPEWVEIIAVTDKYKQQLLEMQLDKGESSAIALALEIPDSILILDDYKARKVAQRLGVHITGTIGVIIKEKLNGLIPSILPLIQKIRQTDFRISDELEKQALIVAREIF